MDIEALKAELKEKLGPNVKITEAHMFTGMSADIVENLFKLYESYDEVVKKFINRYIPTGQTIEFYVGIMHNQAIVMEWLPVEHIGMEALQWISMVNARVGWIVYNMSPRDKSRFVVLLNSMSKNIRSVAKPHNGNGDIHSNN